MNQRVRLQRKRTTQPESTPLHQTAERFQDATRAGGAPLDAITRAHFESRFGHDFGQVRIHSGASLDSTAPGAVAITMGQDIAFRAGEYAPESREGRWLLAHELTHVVQQAGQAQPDGGPASRSRDASDADHGTAEAPAQVSQRSDTSEQAADRAASYVMAGGTGAAALAGSAYGATVQPYIANPDIWDNMPSFGDFDLGGGIAGIGSAIGSGISGIGGLLGGGLMAGGGLLGGEVADIGGGIGGTIASAGSAYGSGIEAIGSLFGEGSAGAQIGSLLGGTVSGIGSILGGSVAGGAADFGADIFGAAAGLSSDVMGGAGALGAGVSGVASGIGSLVSGLGEMDPSWFLM